MREPLKLQRTCQCQLIRRGYAGAIIHKFPCKQQGVEFLAQSGDSITPGKQYRWINGDDQWARDRGHEEINVVAEVTRVDRNGMIYAFWHQDRPQDDQYGKETCIHYTSVVELVEKKTCRLLNFRHFLRNLKIF